MLLGQFEHESEGLPGADFTLETQMQGLLRDGTVACLAKLVAVGLGIPILADTRQVIWRVLGHLQKEAVRAVE